jgi:hypothetical protein
MKKVWILVVSNLQKKITLCHFCVAQDTKTFQIEIFARLRNTSLATSKKNYNFLKLVNIFLILLIHMEHWSSGAKRTFHKSSYIFCKCGLR